MKYPQIRSLHRSGALTAATVLSTLALAACPAFATDSVITADTTGNDSFTDAGFYGVAFTSGSGTRFIQSVSYDLSGIPGAFFDFDGIASFNDGTAPILDPGSLVGLTAGDISFSFIGVHPTLLTFNFAAGTFGVGDSFRFGADTEGLNNTAVTPGGVFGTDSIPFGVTLEDLSTGSAHFGKISAKVSTATVTIAGTSGPAVPEPGAIALAMSSGVGGVLLSRRRRNR